MKCFLFQNDFKTYTDVCKKRTQGQQAALNQLVSRDVTNIDFDEGRGVS